MKCNRCGSEWTASPGLSVSMTSCPFCGKSLLPEQKKLDTVEDVLVEINRQFGISVLTDATKLVGYFADLAPQLYSKQRRILGYFIECNGPKKLSVVMNAPENEQLICMKQLIREMKDEMFIDETASRMICNAFLFSVSGRRLAELTAEEQHQKRISGTPSLRMVPMKDRLAAGLTFFQLTDDGRVICEKYPFKELDVGKWCDIIAIDASPLHIVGLRSDGTVVATGYNLQGECSVSAWKNITAICADSDTFGLRQDGTVVATGLDWDTSSLRNVTGIACGPMYFLGLHADGTLTAIGRKGENPQFFSELQRWRNLVAAAVGKGFTVGLHADGTVIAAGDNSKGTCNVSSWRNIISVRCGMFHTVGLRSDGTVVATGWNKHGQCDVSTWRNIVSISAGDQVTYGLRTDGTVVSTA